MSRLKKPSDQIKARKKSKTRNYKNRILILAVALITAISSFVLYQRYVVEFDDEPYENGTQELDNTSSVLGAKTSSKKIKYKRINGTKYRKINALASKRWGGVCDNGKKIRYTYYKKPSAYVRDVKFSNLPKLDFSFTESEVNREIKEISDKGHQYDTLAFAYLGSSNRSLASNRTFCRIYYNENVIKKSYESYYGYLGLTTSEFMCLITVHETGHLGDQNQLKHNAHSTNKNSIMYPDILGNINIEPQCKGV